MDVAPLVLGGGINCSGVSIMPMANGVGNYEIWVFYKLIP